MEPPMSRYQVQHKNSPKGKWAPAKTARPSFATEEQAWQHAAAYDEDGYCHPATIRVFDLEAGETCTHRSWPAHPTLAAAYA